MTPKLHTFSCPPPPLRIHAFFSSPSPPPPPPGPAPPPPPPPALDLYYKTIRHCALSPRCGLVFLHYHCLASWQTLFSPSIKTQTFIITIKMHETRGRILICTCILFFACLERSVWSTLALLASLLELVLLTVNNLNCQREYTEYQPFPKVQFAFYTEHLEIQ